MDDGAYEREDFEQGRFGARVAPMFPPRPSRREGDPELPAAPKGGSAHPQGRDRLCDLLDCL